jgi:hypothetical protein
MLTACATAAIAGSASAPGRAPTASQPVPHHGQASRQVGGCGGGIGTQQHGSRPSRSCIHPGRGKTGFAELKTCLRGPGRLLRGRTPDLARQELWAYLAIYQALRTLITRAAARDGTDPARISFTAALHAAQRTMTAGHASQAAALDATETEICSCLVPRREGRISPRRQGVNPRRLHSPQKPPRPHITTQHLHHHHHHPRHARTNHH